jgi:hypothetical protein
VRSALATVGGAQDVEVAFRPLEHDAL